MSDPVRVGVGLRNDCIDAKPIDFDWSEGYSERWDVHPSCRKVLCEDCDGSGHVDCGDCDGTGEIEEDCPECGGTGEVEGETEALTCDECDGTGTVKVECNQCDGSGEIECERCEGEGRVEDEDNEAGFPMMNYAYPLGSRDVPDDVGTLLDHLPLTVVEVDGTNYLALTGGGMDLSWEICAAYVALGYYPPAHFCNLPRMAGRGNSDGDKRLLAICREALEMQAQWAAGAAERFRREWPQSVDVQPRTIGSDERAAVASALESEGEAELSGYTIKPTHGQAYTVDGPAVDDEWCIDLDTALALVANRR